MASSALRLEGKGNVVYNITSYFGNQEVQIGNNNIISHAMERGDNLVSIAKDLSYDGSERDQDILKVVLNSILSPKKSRVGQPMPLRTLESAFADKYGKHLPGKKSFSSVSGMDLACFIEKHNDFFHMYSSKGKVMVKSKQCIISETSASSVKVDRTKSVLDKPLSTEKFGSEKSTSIVDESTRDITDTDRLQTDSIGWEKVVGKRKKRRLKQSEECANCIQPEKGTAKQVLGNNDPKQKLVLSLLERGSGNTLKFVPCAEVYENNYVLFTVDIVSMWNTPQRYSAYILVGVDESIPHHITGLQKSYSNVDYQRMFLNECTTGSLPLFKYSEVSLPEGNVGILEILSSQGKQTPCIVNCNRKNSVIEIHDGDMWIRQESSCVVCKPTEETFAEVYRWFSQNAVETFIQEDNSKKGEETLHDREEFNKKPTPTQLEKTQEGLQVCITAEQFLEIVHNFRKGHFILIAGNVPKDIQLGALSLVPWISVLDFDPHSRDNGLLCCNEESISRKTSLQITTWQTICKCVSEYRTNWCFMRGSREDPQSRDCFSDDPRRWFHKTNQNVTKYAEQIQGFVADYTVLTSIIIWPQDEKMLPHIQKTITQLDASIDPPPKLVLLLHSEPQTENGKAIFRMICEDQRNNLTIVRLNLEDILSAVADNFKQHNQMNEPKLDLPALEDRNVCISNKDALWLREDLNVLYVSNPYTKGENDVEFLKEENDNFYRGGTLQWCTWYACKAGHLDAERDILKATKKDIQKYINENRSGIVTLYHAPGAGGTTFAQRVIWDFHERIPTVHVRTKSIQSLSDLSSKIEFLYNKTRRPVLLLIDGEEEQKVSHLMLYLKRICISIILFVKRSLTKPNISNVEKENKTIWLSGTVSTDEAKQLVLKFSTHCKDDEAKQKALNKLCKEIELGKQHNLISFGLTVFLHEFRGVTSFVRGYLPIAEYQTSLSTEQTILAYLSLAYFYGHSSLPCQFFNELLNLPANYCVDLEDFPSPVEAFVVQDEGEGKKDNIRICHYLVAKEILNHLLTRNNNIIDTREHSLSDQARHKLGALCLDFIDYASRRKTRSSTSSNTIIHCLTRVFIVRDSMEPEERTESPKRKSSLSKILSDMHAFPPQFRERLDVLKRLVSAFPDDPNFQAHLGRFYANYLPEEEKEAERCFLKALDLCEVHKEWMKNTDGKIYDRWKVSLMYIYHMYGMFLLKRLKRDTGKSTFEEIENTSVQGKPGRNMEHLLDLAKQACSLFLNSRMHTIVGHESGYGYTGEIEVRLHFCDFVQREDTIANLQTNARIHDLTKVFVRKSIPILDQLISECAMVSKGQGEIGYSINKYMCWYNHLFKGKDVALCQLDQFQDVESCRLKIAMKKINNTCGKNQICTIDSVQKQEDIEEIIKLYENIFEMVNVCHTFREKKTLESNLLDWLKAIRHREVKSEYSIAQVLGKVTSIDCVLASPVSKFYLFILKSLQGLGIGSTHVDIDALYDARHLKKELKLYGREILRSKYPREWVGNTGTGIMRLLPSATGFQFMSMLSESRSSRDFALLQIFKGSISHPNNKKLAGQISLDLGENTCPVEVFFIPEVASLSGTHHAGQRVEFTLAFSIENGYEAFHVTPLKKFSCTNYPCSAKVEITSAEEFGVCGSCKRIVYRDDLTGRY